MRNNRERLLGNSSVAAIGAALAVAAAFPNIANALPAGCVLLGNQVTCTGTVGAPDANEQVFLDPGQNLINNATIYGSVFGSFANTITNNVAIISSANETFSSDLFENDTSSVSASTTAVTVGNASVLHNYSLISATAGTTTTIGLAGGEGSHDFTVEAYSSAIGVERDWGAQIYNDCVITATASNAITLTNFYGNNDVYVGTFAIGISGTNGPNLIQNSAGNTITASAANTFTLSTFGETSTYVFGPVAAAAGILVSTGSVVDNHGTVSATATTTITATDGFGLTVFGATGAVYQYVPDTSLAIGIGVDHMANITNSGTVTATATLSVSLTNVSGSSFQYDYTSSDNARLSPGATAIGILVGNVPNQESYYSNSISIDTIINNGTVTASATVAFTLVDSPNNYVETNSSATGILAEYTEGRFCCGQDDLPPVWGTVAITNFGTVTATATNTLSFTLNGAEMSSGEQSFYLNSYATGIAAYRTSTGGGEGGGPIATIINNGTVSATATSAATFNITDYYGSFYANAYSGAIGIYSDSSFPACCSNQPGIGPNITNNGTLNATATSSVTFSYTATDAGWGEVSHNVDVTARAAGIVLSDGYGIVQNYGPINATATATWSITSTGNGYVGYYGSVDAEAVGIAANYFANVYNASDITATATASVSVTSNGGFDNIGRYDNLYIYSRAVGIGGAEGFAGGEGLQLKVINDGNINATATSLFSSNAIYDSNYYTRISSDARGIWVPYFNCCGDRGVEVVNNGTITALALSQFTLTNNPALEPTDYINRDMDIEAYAAGIHVDGDYGVTVTNNGTIIAVASAVYKLVGFSTPTYGGFSTGLTATSYGMRVEYNGYEGYTVVNNGTIFSTATILVDAPNYIFEGSANATAYGIYANEGYFVHNTGSVFATATVTLPGGAEGRNTSNDFDNGAFFQHWRGNSSERPARAYGVKIEGFATFVNDGTIWANAYVSVGGTILQGMNDPSAAFGIYGRGGDTITNNGIVGTSRVGPMHWAVYISGNYGSSQFFNYGTTIGSFHINGEGSTAQNFATMTFRTIQPSDGILQTANNQENAAFIGEVWAQYGTYDRIAVHTNSSFDTTLGTILIQPLGNAGLYPNVTRFRYFIDCDQASSCSNISGLTLGQQANLKSTSAFLVPSLDNPADFNNVGNQGYDLILTRLAFTTPNLPGNQGNVGGGLEGLFGGIQGNPGGKLGDLLAKIQVLGAGDVPGAYQQLAGEIVSNIGQIGAANAGQLLGLLFGRFNEARGGVQNAARNVQFASRDFDIAQAPPGASRTATTIPGMGRWTGWVSGYGQTGQVDSQAGISGARFNVAGGLGGLEYTYSDTVRIGFTLGAGSSWVKLNDLDSRANGTFFQAAIYGSYAPGPWYVDAAVGYAHHSIDTKRTVNFPGFSDYLKGSTAANQFIGGFEAGWRFDVNRFQVTPFFGMQFSVFSQDSYTESGGAAALSFGDTTTVSARSSLGIQGRTRFDLSETMRIDPYARIAWAHEFGDRSPTASASFVGVPSSSFSVVGAKRARDSFLFGTGFDMTLTQSVGVFANYLGDFSSSGTSHAGTAGVRVRW